MVHGNETKKTKNETERKWSVPFRSRRLFLLVKTPFSFDAALPDLVGHLDRASFVKTTLNLRLAQRNEKIYTFFSNDGGVWIRFA